MRLHPPTGPASIVRSPSVSFWSDSKCTLLAAGLGSISATSKHACEQEHAAIKKSHYIYLATFILLTIFLWTDRIGEAGGFGYRLVLKPYPSLPLMIPNMEETGWNDAVAAGSVPQWVVREKYFELAYGDMESPARPWECVYSGLIMLTPLMALLSAVLFVWQVSQRFRNPPLAA